MTRLMTCFFTTICLCIFATATFSLAAGYKLSMLPRYSIEEINSRIIPLAKYLSMKTGLEITPTLTSTFDQYTKQLTNGGIDIGFQNPYIYVLASKAHEVMAMAIKGVDRDKFRGIIITSANSPLHSLSELKGKKISIVSYTSAGGYLSQKLTLQENGIDIQNECTLEEAPENKQENVIFAVHTGDADAGFIRESALHIADAFVPASSLSVLEGTAWLPNWALSVSRDMPHEDRKKIAKAIQDLYSGDPVLKALKIKEFRMAQDSEYDVVRKAAGLEIQVTE
jgi:phosphonate transport system substrate-binding protein